MDRCRCRQTRRRVERLGMRIVNTINQSSCLPYLYLCISNTRIYLFFTKCTLPRPRTYQKDYISDVFTIQCIHLKMKGGDEWKCSPFGGKVILSKSWALTQEGNDFLQLPKDPPTHRPPRFRRMMKSKVNNAKTITKAK